MPLRQCQHGSCESAAQRRDGSCTICSSHFCAKHKIAPLHTCPSETSEEELFWERAGEASRARLLNVLHCIDAHAITEVASLHRGGGISCTIPALTRDGTGELDNWKLVETQMGGQNCHLDLVFEDGVTWLARIRLQDPHLPPAETQAYISGSEVATLHWLHAMNLPVPQLYHHDLKGSGGVPYMLMEKLEGSALDWNDATLDQRKKVMEQLADVFLRLAALPLARAGSIIEAGSCASETCPTTSSRPSLADPRNSSAQNGNGLPRLPPVIGPYAQVQLFEAPAHAIGPFNDLQTTLQSMMAHQKKLISSGEMYCSFAVDLYMSYSWRKSKIPEVVAYCKKTTHEPGSGNGTPSTSNAFFLRHYDDKGDHILVDDDFNITGIIDWEFASAEPKEFAFSSPCMMWPVSEYFDGSDELSQDELEFAAIFEQKGRSDMAGYIRQGRKMQRFLGFNGGGVPGDVDEHKVTFQAMRRAWADGEEIEEYEVWKEAASVQYADDEGLQSLLRR